MALLRLVTPAAAPAAEPVASRRFSQRTMRSDMTGLHLEDTARDLECIERVRAGDARAFEALFAGYYEPMVRYAFGLVQVRAIAEELVQDVFVNLWERRERWTVQSSIRTYLFGATRNRALNWLRHATLHRQWAESIDPLDDSATPLVPRVAGADEHVRLVELRAAILRAIEQLPGRRRETFLLSREHHLTYEQIAEVMGVSVKTVEEQIARALRSLRASLAQWLE